MRQIWPIYAWTVVLVLVSLGVGVKYSREYPPSIDRDLGTRLSEMFSQHTQPPIQSWIDRIVRNPFS